ncbi:MAG: Fe-S protein assembly co-chaperone HscB [Magnetococcales bacterium]|nr:Fe-S protein assembly co-chaperone HscB [Magnetococcales bacterium]
MSAARACWSCKGPAGDAAFCVVCGVLQPPDSGADLFAVLGLPRGFDLDRPVLEESYRQAQQRFHPDRFATRSAGERRYSLEWITRINTAFQTLGNPLTRARHLLELLGHAAPEHRNTTPVDPAFLMEVMELREALAEVDPAADDAPRRLERLRREVEQRVDLETGLIRDSLARAMAGEGTTVLEEAVRHLDRLRYHQRFLEEVDRLEERLF